MAGVPVAFAIALVAGGLVLAGCAQGNPYALPGYQSGGGRLSAEQAGGQPGQSGSAPGQAADAGAVAGAGGVRPAARPRALAYRPADNWGEGAWVERGTIVATSAQQRAAVSAVVSYLSLRVELSNTWQVDERGLAAVAAGQALSSARERAASQREAQRRSVGRFVVNVSSVRTGADTAVVTGCNFDATAEVDPSGGVIVPPPGGVLITMELRRTGGVWRVVQWPDHPVPYCDWRVG